jgi:hypothetical protein
MQKKGKIMKIKLLCSFLLTLLFLSDSFAGVCRKKDGYKGNGLPYPRSGFQSVNSDPRPNELLSTGDINKDGTIPVEVLQLVSYVESRKTSKYKLKLNDKTGHIGDYYYFKTTLNPSEVKKYLCGHIKSVPSSTGFLFGYTWRNIVKPLSSYQKRINHKVKNNWR